MKKYLALALFVLMLCAFLTSAAPVMAEEAGTPATDEGTVTLPLPDVEVPQEAVTKSEEIVAWIKENLEEISVICTLVLTVFYNARKHGVLNKTIKTLNNNSITVAENSNAAVNNALAGVSAAADTVGGFAEQMNAFLAEARSTAEDKKLLESKLVEATNFIHTAQLANMELANEVAELLVLANIPNAKKEELYSRHRKAVDAITEAEKMEVKEDVTEKA